MKKEISILLITALLFSSVFMSVFAQDTATTTIEGIEGTMLSGGTFSELNSFTFAETFEGDGNTGSNGTVAVDNGNGLKAKVEDNVLKYYVDTVFATKRQSMTILEKSFTLPVQATEDRQYYLELPIDSYIAGTGEFIFEDENQEVAFRLVKTEESEWKIYNGADMLVAQTDYVLTDNQDSTTFGILWNPVKKVFVVYADGQLLMEAPADFAKQTGNFDKLLVVWKGTTQFWNINPAEHLNLKELLIYQGEKISLTDKESVDTDIANLVLPAQISNNIILPTEGANGTTIIWESNRPDILTETGIVVRPELDETVTLKAIVSKGNETVSKEFVITVLGTQEFREIEGIEDTYFNDGLFTWENELAFSSCYEEPGTGGSNGIVLSTAPIKAEKNAEGLSYLIDNGGTGADRNTVILDRTFEIPTFSDSTIPYFLEFSLSFNVAGALTFYFGKDGEALELRRRDSYTGTDGVSAPEGGPWLDYKVGGQTIASVENCASGDMTIGIYVIPALEQMVLYYNGEKISQEIYQFSKEGAKFNSLRIVWTSSIRWWAINPSEYVTLRHVKFFTGNELTELQKMQLDFEKLEATDFTAQNLQEITQNLTLPLQGTFGSNIVWESSAPEIVNAQSGIVTRPQEDTQVTLTAAVSCGTQSPQIKTFLLTVLKKTTDGNLLKGKKAEMNTASTEDMEQLTDENYHSYIESIDPQILPVIIIDMEKDTVLSDVILYEGMVADSYSIQGGLLEVSTDEENWTVVAEIGTIGEKKQVHFAPISGRYLRFSVTKKEKESTVRLYEIEAVMNASDIEIVRADLRDLTAFPDYIVSQSVALPTMGRFGAKLEWNSSNPSVISAAGTVTKPIYDTEVILIATAKYGEATDTKTFQFKVLGSGSSGGGSSGGGSSGGGSGGRLNGSGVVNIVAEPSTTTPQPTIPSIDQKEQTFTDVAPEHWAYPYVEKLAEIGVVNGDENGNFCPEERVTREEVVKMIMETFDFDLQPQADGGFVDVVDGQWYAPYVNSANKLGLVTGLRADLFGTGTYISRQDMAVMAYRAVNLKGKSLKRQNSIAFLDIDNIAPYASESVAALAEAGIISGDETQNFWPLEAITRSETAKILCLLYDEIRN